MLKVITLQITTKEKVLVDIAFEIKKSLALIGESGSGKSLSLKALLGMLPKELELILKVEAPFTLEAGKTISYVPQNPFTALSPLTKIKHQFLTSIPKAKELLSYVGLEENFLEKYPSELSGGQLQRVVIAMALEHHPKLLLLDEPTTALDPATTQMVLELLLRLQEEMGFYMLFVTHDIQSGAKIAEDICVIRNGKVVEIGNRDIILHQPQAQYTKKLIEANFANREFRK